MLLRPFSRLVFASAIVALSASAAFATPINLNQRRLAEFHRLEREKIKHVVIIVQENRSVDNFFNGLPGADTVASGMSHDGEVKLHPVDLNSPADVDHQHRAFVREYDDGKMDGWDSVRTLPRQDPDFPYAYVPRDQIEPYWDMAEQYTFGDRMFQSNTGPSFPAHLYLVAGQSDYAANNPNHIETGHFAWGCDSPLNATVSLIGPRGNEIKGPYPCFNMRTLADVMDDQNVAWRYYAPAIDSVGNIWSAFDAIRHIRYGPDWGNVVSPETRVLSDAANDDLPAVTWVVPTAQNSDHAFPQREGDETSDPDGRRAARAGVGRIGRQRDRPEFALEQHGDHRRLGRLGRLVRSRRPAAARPHGPGAARAVHRHLALRATPLRLARAARVRQYPEVLRRCLRFAAFGNDGTSARTRCAIASISSSSRRRSRRSRVP